MNAFILLQIAIFSHSSRQPSMVSNVIHNRYLVWWEPSSINTYKPWTNQLISLLSHFRSDDNFFAFKTFWWKVRIKLKIHWDDIVLILNNVNIWFTRKDLNSSSKVNFWIWYIVFITNKPKSNNSIKNILILDHLNSAWCFCSDRVIARCFSN